MGNTLDFRGNRLVVSSVRANSYEDGGFVPDPESITTAALEDGAVVNAKVGASAAIAATKIAVAAVSGDSDFSFPGGTLQDFAAYVANYVDPE